MDLNNNETNTLFIMKVVHIYKDGTMDELDIDTVDDLLKHSKSQGEGTLQSLYHWKYLDATLYCYGWYDGEAGFENKHELPPGGASDFMDEDSSTQLLYGDIFILKYIETELQSFDISEYGEFYNMSFGGFSDISDESEQESTDDELDDFIVQDEEIEDEGDDEYHDDIKEYGSELEEDTYEY